MTLYAHPPKHPGTTKNGTPFVLSPLADQLNDASDFAAALANLAYAVQADLDNGSLDAGTVMDLVCEVGERRGLKRPDVARQFSNAIKAVRKARHGSELPSPPQPPSVSQPAKKADNSPLLSVVRLADVQPEAIEWLWFPYLPLAKLTLLEGDPGLGKSWLTCALATAIAAGNGLPGMDARGQANVLMLSAEDGLADTIRPRLDSMRADVARIYALETPVTFDAVGLLAVEELIAKLEPALVIVDPLVAYFGGSVDLHRANETREVMARLAITAAKFRCAILCVRHLAKGGTNKAIYRGLGSIDIAAAVRSVLLVGADPDQPSVRAIVQTKNNLAAFGEPVGYELRADGFFWTGSSHLTAERILNTASAGDDEQLGRREAEDFLREILGDGAKPAKDVQCEAKQAGLSETTLNRTKRALGIKSKKYGGNFGGKAEWYWELPAEDGQDATEDGHTREGDHLQANHSDKSNYSNGFAEDGHYSVFDHLQHPVDHLQHSNGKRAGREVVRL
jgi:hypothetical protein